jgi:DNA-binding GntR family transcriptional regulator
MVNDDVYSMLRDLILREEVLPNERLIESDYAERFNTNRSSIRKALATLEREGLVVIEPFKGAHVRRITDKEAIEMTEVRTALETLLVRYAAERAGDADKEQLRETQSVARTLLQESSPIEVGAAARRVRECMWRISGHITGQNILVTINSQLIRIWFRAILMPGRAEEIVDQLDPVVDAICANDPDRAVAAMHTYHAASMAALKRAVQNANVHSSSKHLPV